MLAAVLAPLEDHDAAAPPADVPALAAPAAVPALVLGLEGAVGQRALGQAVARGRRVRDGLLREGPAGLPRGGAVRDVRVDVFAGEAEGHPVTHGGGGAGQASEVFFLLGSV